MKIIKRILPMMLVVMLLGAALPSTAEAKTYEQSASDSVTVKIPVTKGFGGKGTVTFSNESLFSSISITGSNLGSFQESNRKIAFASSSEITNGSINVTVKIKANATAGETCTISVSNYKMVNASDNMEAATLESQTVTIKAASQPDDKDEPSKPSTPSKPSKPSTSTNKTDYTELKKQIGIAEGLKADGYTKDSWSKVVAALDAARTATKSKDQSKVDAAAQALKDAIAALVKVDYSKLQAAIDSAEALIESDKLGAEWNKLFDALTSASGLLASDDQAAVDAAAKEIEDIIAQIKELLSNDKQDVVKEPTGKYCNVAIHKVWPILFFISLAGNIVLVVLLVGKKKKENQIDDTPIVNYEIGEDDK